MGTFNITSSTLNNSYEYKDENIIVNGNYTKNAQTDSLQSINGSCYRINSEGEEGDLVGNFNGNVRNGEIYYSLSEMPRRDANLVWDAIDEIEQYVKGENIEE